MERVLQENGIKKETGNTTVTLEKLDIKPKVDKIKGEIFYSPTKLLGGP